MTFSREPYQSAISKNEKIGAHERAYFQQRLKNRVFANIVETFVDRAERYELSKARVATLTDKDPATVNRLLSLPSNLTLETLSDLALALGCEPEITLERLDDPPRHNFVHDWMKPFAGDQPSDVEFVEVDQGYLRPGKEAKALDEVFS